MKKTTGGRKDAGISFLGGALSLTLAAVTVKLLGLAYKLPLSRLLGDEGMGYYNSAYAVYGFIYLVCTSGVPKAVSLLVTEARTKGNVQEAKQVFRTALFLFSGVGLFLSFSLYLTAGKIASLIGNPDAALALQSVAPSVFFVSVTGVLRGYLNGYERLLPVAVSEVTEACVKVGVGLLLSWVSLKRGWDLYRIAAASVAGISVGTLLPVLLLARNIRNLHREAAAEGRGKKAAGGVFSRLLSVSFPLTLGSCVASFGGVLDLGLIMRRIETLGYTPAEASAVYGNYSTLCMPMFTLVSSLIAPLSMAYLPRLSAARVRDDREFFSQCAGEYLSFSGALFFPAMFGLAVYSEEILMFLFADESAEIAAPLLVLLAPAVCVFSLLTVLNTVSESCGYMRVPLISMLVSSLIKPVCSYFLLGNLSFGIAGAPVGTVVAYTAGLLFSLAFLLGRKNLRFPVLRPLVMPCVCAAGAVFVPRLLCGTFSFGRGLPFPVLFAVSAALYLILLSLCGFFGGKKSKNRAF